MTTTHISLLRGINGSGRKTIKMDLLRQLYGELGFNNTQTYLQTGNIVFQSEDSTASELATMISSKIEERFKFKVDVLVKTIDELKTIISKNPFTVNTGKDTAHLHISLLFDKPLAEHSETILTFNFPPDEFAIVGKSVYIYCPKDYAKTKLNTLFFEKQLNTTATSRNWKTMYELMYMAEEMDLRH